MHQLLHHIDTIARACHQQSGSYPRHLYVGPRMMQDLKKLPPAVAQSEVNHTDIRKLTVLGMKIHPRFILGERVITSLLPLSDADLEQQFPTVSAPYAQDIVNA
jgi:hypothetical protein